MKSNELFRASGIMALGTILSRITGFIRGILIVAVLGTALPEMKNCTQCLDPGQGTRSRRDRCTLKHSK